MSDWEAEFNNELLRKVDIELANRYGFYVREPDGEVREQLGGLIDDVLERRARIANRGEVRRAKEKS